MKSLSLHFCKDVFPFSRVNNCNHPTPFAKSDCQLAHDTELFRHPCSRPPLISRPSPRPDKGREYFLTNRFPDERHYCDHFSFSRRRSDFHFGIAVNVGGDRNPCCQMAKFDPFLSLDCASTPSTLAQSKERKGSNFAVWQHGFRSPPILTAIPK